MKAVLGNLRKMPIFKMSLGSKELFHSNFLEFLWEIDHDMFIKIVNKLLTKDPKASQPELVTDQTAPKYELSREKENFDISISHKEVIANRERTVYDLVIENKVKSMPRKGQLDDYVSKINKNGYSGGCRYLLLSLATGFPDEEDIKKTWAIVNYDDLKNAIEGQGSFWKSGEASSYIEDYCKFIVELHNLQDAIFRDFSSTYLFQDEDIKLCRKYRLHDLYIKLRCDKFLIGLKERLESELQKLGLTLPITFISKYSGIEAGKQGIYLNTSINQGVGQAAVFMHLQDGKPVNNYEIVIQGKQYRHGINSKEGKGCSDYISAQEKIYDNITDVDKNFLEFVFFPWDENVKSDETDILPLEPKKNKYGERKKALNGYDTTYIYKHIDIVNVLNVEALLELMTQDVLKTIEYILANQ